MSQTVIPDNNFELYLETHDSNLNTVVLGATNSMGDGILNNLVPTNKIASVLEINVPSLNITDLSGIEDFTALTHLDCSDNELSFLNISQNINLTELYCGSNHLTNLDVSLLNNLVRLWCFENQLTSLNVTQNPNLISLRCENNLLTSLNTSNNIKLNVFVCEINQITSLDLSNNILLDRLQCGGNNSLSALNVSNNINLSYLSCDSCQISTLNLTQNTALRTLICFENLLTELDLSNNAALTTIHAYDNNLCLLNLKNGNNRNFIETNFNSNPNLNCVIVDNPNADHTSWLPANFLNYVDQLDKCNGFINIDELNDVITFTPYTLPILTHGNYYTQPEGNGINLNAGDLISTSQSIYIYKEIDCFSNESSFNVFITDELYIPKYFTPNNDGTHDFWKVLDNTNTIESVSIFNRYGKFLKFLQPNSLGWNGYFNGKLMPTDDYWYIIRFNTGEILKGNFTLKR